jgi:ADP-ribosylglycohydrolase
MMHIASYYNKDMESNGSLMRIVPLAIWSHNLPDNSIALNARLDALLSHPNPVCQDCNVLYCLAVGNLIKTGDSNSALEVVEKFVESGNIHPKVKEWLEDSKNEITSFDCTVNIGHVKHAFTLAFYFLRRNISYKESIIQTLMLGGDTDTNAAIVGGMIGARYGSKQIPDSMKEPVLAFDCTSGLGHKRPKRYKASLCKELSEQLMRIPKGYPIQHSFQ